MKPLVLFVDDEDIILQGLRNQLSPHLGREFTLEFTNDVNEGLEILEEFDGLDVPSVVVSDWMMPGINGAGFLREVHANFPRTKKVILTGQASQEDVKELMQEIGIERAIRKPWEKEDLIHLIEEVTVPEFMQDRVMVLCVDDEPTVLKSLRNQLRRFFGTGFMIETAESGEEALELLDELAAENNLPHLIISDQLMPRMKGDELLIKVCEKYPQIIRILLTGQASEQNIINAINKAGLYRFISKPWNIDDLNLTVKSGLESFDAEQKVREEQQRVLDLYLSLEEKVKERTQQIIAQNELIAAQNLSIKSSINYAKRIQEAILPPVSLIKDFFDDAFVYYRPKDIVSGDFYLFWKTAEDTAFIATIDCTGHGVPGAFLTIISKFIVEIVSNKDNHNLLPDKILYHVNRKLIEHLITGDEVGQPMKDGMDIALCMINYSTQKLHFSGAYHSLILMQNNELHEVRGDRRSIGFTPTGKNNHPGQFDLHEMNFNRGDRIYMMSDGYTDQFGGIYNKKFRKKRLHKLLCDIQHKNLTTQNELIQFELEKWRKEEEQTDDIVFIGIQF